jgi:hypothetical protein
MLTIMITIMISELALRCQTVYSCGLAVALMLYTERQGCVCCTELFDHYATVSGKPWSEQLRVCTHYYLNG